MRQDDIRKLYPVETRPDAVTMLVFTFIKECRLKLISYK